jgi:GTPase
MLPRETESGCVEYKRQLLHPSPWRFQQLVSQLKWRLSEGGGRATYYIGVEDDGSTPGVSEEALAASLATLRAMAAALGCVARVGARGGGSAPGCVYARCAVGKARVAAAHSTPARVALAGAAGAGKSTLLAALLLGRVDDGAGGARAAVAAHPHELLSGRTSALRHHRLGYDAAAPTPLPPPTPGVASGDACEEASAAGGGARMLTLLELPCAGAFARTALFGVTAAAPHATLLLCAAGGGVPAPAAQHLAAALACGVPTAALLTRCDAAHAGGADADAQPLRAVLSAAARAHASACAVLFLGAAGMPIGADADAAAPLVRDAACASALAAALCAHMPHAPHAASTPSPPPPLLFPVVRVSCVSGEGLAALHALLAGLAAPQAHGHNAAAAPVADAPSLIFHVEALLAVPGAPGIVAAGVAAAGGARRGDVLRLGPLGRRGAFARVRVASIHAAAADVMALRQGQAATLALQECEDGDDDIADDVVADTCTAEADDATDDDEDAVPARPLRVGGLLARALAQRKGLVLLRSAPRQLQQLHGPLCAVWAFDALLVPLCAGGTGGGALRSALATGHLHSAAAACMVHCGSVRQAARVASLSHADAETAAQAAVATLRVRAAAAAAVLAFGAAAHIAPPPPPALRARLLFAHRPQWLAHGATLLLADPSGGAGLVAAGLVLSTDCALSE